MWDKSGGLSTRPAFLAEPDEEWTMVNGQTKQGKHKLGSTQSSEGIREREKGSQEGDLYRQYGDE